jgi:hypothetical protein
LVSRALPPFLPILRRYSRNSFGAGIFAI